MLPATTSLPASGAADVAKDLVKRVPEANQDSSPRASGDSGEPIPDAVDLRRAVADWAKTGYVPLDPSALDPPEFCDRCHQPIRPDDPIDYLTEEDGSVLIVHECCPGPPTASTRPE